MAARISSESARARSFFTVVEVEAQTEGKPTTEKPEDDVIEWCWDAESEVPFDQSKRIAPPTAAAASSASAPTQKKTTKQKQWRCNQCNGLFAFYGQNGTCTHLVRHMGISHKVEWSGPGANQPQLLPQAGEKRQREPQEQRDRTDLHKFSPLIDYFAQCNVPFAHVQHPAFLNIAKASLLPTPTPQRLSVLTSARAAELRKKLLEQLSGSVVSLATDLGTVHRHYCVIVIFNRRTAHFWRLYEMPAGDSHWGNNVATFLRQTIDELNAHKITVASVVSDNASVMTKAVREAGRIEQDTPPEANQVASNALIKINAKDRFPICVFSLFKTMGPQLAI